MPVIYAIVDERLYAYVHSTAIVLCWWADVSAAHLRTSDQSQMVTHRFHTFPHYTNYTFIHVYLAHTHHIQMEYLFTSIRRQTSNARARVTKR